MHEWVLHDDNFQQISLQMDINKYACDLLYNSHNSLNTECLTD